MAGALAARRWRSSVAAVVRAAVGGLLRWVVSSRAPHLLVPPVNARLQERARADAISMAERCEAPGACALVRMHLFHRRDR